MAPDEGGALAPLGDRGREVERTPWRADLAERVAGAGGDGGAGGRGGRCGQAGVLGRQALGQGGQARPGVEAQLVGEEDPRSLDGGDRVVAPARARQGQRQLLDEALAEGVRLDRGGELADGERGAVVGEQQVEARLHGREAQLVEPGRLAARPGLAGEVAERRPVPPGERGLEGGAPVGRGGGSAAQGIGHLLLEAEGLEVDEVGAEAVAVAHPLDRRHRAAERFAEVGDVALQRVGRRGGGRAVPQLVDDAVGRHDRAGGHRQAGEHRPLARPAERDRRARHLGAHRPEHADRDEFGAVAGSHVPGVARCPSTVAERQRSDGAPLPRTDHPGR
ncbi:MAG: hypothetical protein R2711_13175 [Acidimicrobiales bacterium]